MKFDHLPPLREDIATHGLLAKKSFGQHFLLDLNVTRKIARLAGPLEGRAVIEVGPGPGGLTRALLEAGAVVIAIERDSRFLPLLSELSNAADGRLKVVVGDALIADEADLAATHAAGLRLQIVANLPYNIGAPLLVKWLRLASNYDAMTLMFQREVANRIVAGVGDADYGRLSVLVSATTKAQTVMFLPARAFTPPPKVNSAVVHLTPHDHFPDAFVLDALERVTKCAFGQRRKMLRSSLKAMGGATLCHAAGIDPDLRAEAISPEGFLELAAHAPAATSEA